MCARGYGLACLVVGVPLLACTADRADEGARARADIEHLMTRLPGWYAAGQSDSLTQLYEHNAVIFNPNSPPIVGRDAIASFQRRMLNGADWEVSLTTESLDVHGPLAVQHSRYDITLTVEGVETPFVDRGHSILVWRRTAREWKIQYDISNSEIPRP